jgi:hypothetical protein
MKASALKDMPVVSMADGTQVGKVADAGIAQPPLQAVRTLPTANLRGLREATYSEPGPLLFTSLLGQPHPRPAALLEPRRQPKCHQDRS